MGSGLEEVAVAHVALHHVTRRDGLLSHRVDGVGTSPLCTLVAGPLVGVEVARLHGRVSRYSHSKWYRYLACTVYARCTHGVCMVYAWCRHGVGMVSEV